LAEIAHVPRLKAIKDLAPPAKISM
jgi:hypothetical protein